MTLTEAIVRLDDFRGLPHGWNSYGAAPVTDAAITAAGRRLALWPVDDVPHPVPTVRGGVLLECASVSGRDVEFGPDGREVRP